MPKRFVFGSSEGDLQWGRDLSIAEMGRRDGSEAVNAVLFNGAAISRSRKCVLTPQQGASAIHLQWGRDLSIAEILHCSAFNLIGSGSSMGPRSLDRGNISPKATPCKPLIYSMGPRSLDRGNMTAPQSILTGDVNSMGPRSLDRGNIPGRCGYCLHSLFQWGRDLSIAEIWNTPIPVISPTRVSMGPRSLDRGNSTIGEFRWWIIEQSFNGAAISRSRKYMPNVPTRHQQSHFNGAAISRSRKYRTRRFKGMGYVPLQWGRDLSIAEICQHAVPATPGVGTTSMGPRSLDRGNMHPPKRFVKRVTYFNGAAISRSRKYMESSAR